MIFTDIQRPTGLPGVFRVGDIASAHNSLVVLSGIVIFATNGWYARLFIVARSLDAFTDPRNPGADKSAG